MSRQRRNLRVLITVLKSRFNILKLNIQRKRILLLGITIFICILPMMLALIYTYLAYDENVDNYFWSLELSLQTSLEEELTSFLTLEIISNGFTGVAVIFSLTICCSKIPDYILRTKMTARVLIDKCVLNEFDYGRTVPLLKRIAKKDVIYLSASDIVYFKKSFLLSALGTLFTYGLLIMNFKSPS
ncbi:uncharacterized protein TNIN_415091 [Trichonephila inaurata madagascariensis]|uniref:Uncharacterized protein n=1 Tax=Trichonephila inaurata madagascariensis TaxID=2747483 RepID=A0A8X6Y270_9ARAC|nr:uncharacterized protein TNIN_415091 [Trichonephila inaurata madagascariensis]